MCNRWSIDEKASGAVHVDSTDTQIITHYLVWMELGRTTKTTRRAKHVIRKWCLERFDDKEVKLRYQNALRPEVSGFSESIQGKIERGLKGHSLVSEVLYVVNQLDGEIVRLKRGLR